MKETENNVYFQMHVDLVRKGIMAQLGGKLFMTLVAIASHMDEDRKAFPSKKVIAEELGVTEKTARKYIDELLKKRIEGKPIIQMESGGGYTKRNHIYTIEPISQLSMYGKIPIQPLKQKATVTEFKEEKKKFTAPSVLNYFADKYQETYGDKYIRNFTRDCGLIKKKLIKNYNEEQVKQIIDILFEEYETRWKKPQYPRPTIGALCSFLANECVAIKGEREKKEKQKEMQLKEAERLTKQMQYINEETLPF